MIEAKVRYQSPKRVNPPPFFPKDGQKYQSQSKIKSPPPIVQPRNLSRHHHTPTPLFPSKLPQSSNLHSHLPHTFFLLTPPFSSPFQPLLSLSRFNSLSLSKSLSLSLSIYIDIHIHIYSKLNPTHINTREIPIQLFIFYT